MEHSRLLAYIKLYTAYFTFALFFVCLVIWLFAFPIYVYVFRSNRERERGSAVFPIVSYFYKCVCLSYLVNTIHGVIDCTAFFLQKSPIHSVISFVNNLIGHFDIVFFGAHSIVLSLLTIQRFLLYFFPASEPFVNLKEKSMQRVFAVIYFILICERVVWIVLVGYNIHLDQFYQKMVLTEFVVKHVILIVTTFLYIPIVCSIRKNSHLISIIKNKPDNFIFFQAVMFFVVNIPVLAMIVVLTDDDGLPVNDINDITKISETVFIIALIQVSYLLSNLRNVKLIRKVSYGKMVKLAFTGFFKNSTTVQPIAYIDMTTTTH